MKNILKLSILALATLSLHAADVEFQQTVSRLLKEPALQTELARNNGEIEGILIRVLEEKSF